ncbi:MAG: tetratricopeptide repeat protein [Vicinamibacteria bacterium]
MLAFCELASTVKGSVLDALAEEILMACQNALELEVDQDRAAIVNYNQGVILQHMGRHEEALEPLRRALVMRPEYADALSSLGSALLVMGLEEAAHGRLENAQGFFQEAAQHFDRAISIAPGLPDAYYGLGLALWKLGRHEDAVDAYREDVRLNPEDDYKLVQFAQTLNKVGQHSEAVAVFEQAQRANPEEFVRYPYASEVLEASRRGERWEGWEEAAQSVP